MDTIIDLEEYKMNIIYSSKLYRSSNRKEKIRANMRNPINVELVQQLESYSDDEDKKRSIHNISKERTDSDRISDNDKSQTNNEPVTKHIRFHDDSESMKQDEDSNKAGIIDETLEKDVNSDPITEDSSDTSTSEDSDDLNKDEVSESTHLESQCDTVDQSYLKSFLNSDKKTSGVVRVSSTDDECWVYYNDNVNLNIIIDDVIDSVTDSCSSLIFNRLARKYNAVVFTIENLVKENE